MKLSLCLIVKPTKKESKLLDRCLSYVSDYVDEICITQAGNKPIKEVSDIIKKYNGKESFFKWVNDFSKARNYNFSQATGDYIFWLDADDVVKGAKNLKNVIKVMQDSKIDTGVMNYLYHFDEYKRCTTKHIKTRIVKNDGCVKWVGIIHEDFEETRMLEAYFIKDIEVLHLTDDERIGESAERNLEIAKKAYKKNPDDPRSHWLMANAYTMMRDGKAENFWLSFIDLSKSDEEKFLAYLYLADLIKSTDYALQALLLRPTYPNAYHRISEILYFHGKKELARDFIEIGLNMPIPDKTIIAYNPMEYDYHPLMLLMRIYVETGKFEKAVKIVDTLLNIYPNDENLRQKKLIIKKELGEILEVDKYIKEAEKLKGSKLDKYLNNLPEEIKTHPKVCYLRNINFIKKKSTGKDLVYYCGYTSKVWHPGKQDVGGSEEAVINLSREWADKGWNVTVYNNCEKERWFAGVRYLPYWMYNSRDKQDVTIFWRQLKPVDFDCNSDKIFIDLHDVIPAGEFTKERLKKIDKVFVKTKAHRDLFPKVDDSVFEIIPNGVSPEEFEKTAEKNPYLILNTSSPDRHLDATLDVFEELIKKDPRSPWKLAWYYGWDVYDSVHADDKDRMDWKKKQMIRFNRLVEAGRAEGGRFLPQDKIAGKYLEAGIFLYPTQFYEIHCISAVKAQLAGCICVTSDFAALNETIQYGLKKHTKGEKWEKENTFGDAPNIDSYVKTLKSIGDGKTMLTTRDTEKSRETISFNKDDKNRSEQFKWAKDTYNWDKVSDNWLKIIK